MQQHLVNHKRLNISQLTQIPTEYRAFSWTYIVHVASNSRCTVLYHENSWVYNKIRSLFAISKVEGERGVGRPSWDSQSIWVAVRGATR